MKVSKDVIRQIILDFTKFKEQDCWACSFEDIVDEFVEIQSNNYSTTQED